MSSPAGYVVLSTQRTGSHLLRGVIGSHPAFVHAGEVLIPETPKPGSFDAFMADSTRPTDPPLLWAQYLIHLRMQKPNAAYVGLLVKYEHVKRIAGRDLTTDAAFYDVRIIHLVRQNILRMIASHHLAVARGVHVSSRQVHHGINSVELPAGDIVKRLRKKARLVETFRGRLRSRPHSCEIAYEDIMAGDSVNDELVLRLCDFFGVDDGFARQPRTVRLGPSQLRNMISNYDAVAKAVEGTEFEEMLE